MAVTVTYEVYVMTSNGTWSLVEELPKTGENQAFVIAKKIEKDQRYPTKIILNVYNDKTKKNQETLVYISDAAKHLAYANGINNQRHGLSRETTLSPALEQRISGINGIGQTFMRIVMVILISLLAAFILSSITVIIVSYFGSSIDTYTTSRLSLIVFLITFTLTVLPLLVYFVPWHNFSSSSVDKTSATFVENNESEFYVPRESYSKLKGFFDWMFTDAELTEKYNKITSAPKQNNRTVGSLIKSSPALQKTKKNPLLLENQGVLPNQEISPFDPDKFIEKKTDIPLPDTSNSFNPEQFKDIIEDVGVSTVKSNLNETPQPKEPTLDMENVKEIGDFANTVIEKIKTKHSKINNHGKTGLHLIIAGACEKMCTLLGVTNQDKIKWLITKSIELLGANHSLASTFAGNIETYHYDKDYRYMIDIGSDAFNRLKQNRSDAFLKIPDAFTEWTELEIEKLLKESPIRKSDSIITIMFTDIVGSTRATQALGDTVAQNMIREHNRVVRTALKNHFGREVKHTGDGIMASFLSAYQAVGAAIDIQRNVLDYNLKSETGTFPMMLRIGINSGEPIVEDGDFFGATVQVAARVCSEAKPNQILVSSVVKELSEGKKFYFNDLGMVELRGIQEKKQIFEVAWNKT